MEETRKDMKVLSEEELEKVSGGYDMCACGSAGENENHAGKETETGGAPEACGCVIFAVPK